MMSILLAIIVTLAILVTGIHYRITEVKRGIEIAGIGKYHFGCAGEHGVSAVICVTKVLIVLIVDAGEHAVITLAAHGGEECVITVVYLSVTEADAPLLAIALKDREGHIAGLVEHYCRGLAHKVSVYLFDIGYIVVAVELVLIVEEVLGGVVDDKESTVLGNGVDL